MAEYIERSELLGKEKLLDTDVLRKSKTASFIYDQMMYDIEQAPTVDAVPVVRCKDCRRLVFSDCYGECGMGYLGIVNPWDYCSHGERKGQEDAR